MNYPIINFLKLKQFYFWKKKKKASLPLKTLFFQNQITGKKYVQQIICPTFPKILGYFMIPWWVCKIWAYLRQISKEDEQKSFMVLWFKFPYHSSAKKYGLFQKSPQLCSSCDKFKFHTYSVVFSSRFLQSQSSRTCALVHAKYTLKISIFAK